MKELKVPWEMKVIFIVSILAGIAGVYFEDLWLRGGAAIFLVILTCTVSIMELINDRFNELIDKDG